MGPLVWMWLSLSNPTALQLDTDRISRSPPVSSSSPKSPLPQSACYWPCSTQVAGIHPPASTQAYSATQESIQTPSRDHPPVHCGLI